MAFAGNTGRIVRVAVISDTHGLLRREVVAALRDCTHILHAGDIVRESDLDELRLYGAIYAVRGNNDLWQTGLQDLAGVLRFKIAGVSFLMTHDRYDVPRDLEGVHAVIYGHSHRNIEKTIGKTHCVSNQLGYVFANEHLTFNQESTIVI